MDINFWLLAGSTYNSGSLQTAWGADTNANRAVGQVNALDSTSNDFFLTGVQLEIDHSGLGIASDFQHKSFASELALCQRYFFQATEIGTTSEVTNRPICIGTMFSSSDMRAIIDFPVEMRATPTLSSNDTSDSFYFQRNGSADMFDRLDAYYLTKKRASVRNSAHVSGTAGQAMDRDWETETITCVI